MLLQRKRFQGAQYPMFVDGFELSRHDSIVSARTGCRVDVREWTGTEKLDAEK
jgi:hypothetical protein